jgi:SPP1 family predicted phage head-tail adaptor
MMLNNMKHRIIFEEKKTNNRLPTNGKWEPVIECWAKVEALNGREYFEAAAIQKEKTIKFIIRDRKDINEYMRIVFQGKKYNIDAILPNYTQKNFTTIMARGVA